MVFIKQHLDFVRDFIRTDIIAFGLKTNLNCRRVINNRQVMCGISFMKSWKLVLEMHFVYILKNPVYGHKAIK